MARSIRWFVLGACASVGCGSSSLKSSLPDVTPDGSTDAAAVTVEHSPCSTPKDSMWEPFPPDRPTGDRVIVQHPLDAQALYALGLPTYLSRDGGATWCTVDFPHTRQFPDSSRLFISAADPRLMFLKNADFPTYRYWRTNDAGRTWTETKLPGDAVAFDRHDPALVYALTSQGVETGTEAAARSTDGGVTWAPIVLPGDIVYRRSPLLVHDGTGRLLQAAIAFAKLKLELQLFGSDDAGRTWTQRALREDWELGRDLGGTPQLVASGPSLLVLYRNRLWRSTDRGESWQERPPLAPSTTLHPSTTSANVIYALSRRALFRSGDGGESWVDAGLLKEGHTLFHIMHDDVIVSSSFAGVERATNGRRTSTLIVPRVEGQVVVSHSSPPFVYVGHPQAIWRTSAGGLNWELSNLPTDDVAALAVSIAPHPSRPGTVLAIRTNTGQPPQSTVWRSDDAGRSWERWPRNGNRVGVDIVRRLALATEPPGRVFIGTFKEILRSDDDGDTWESVYDLKGAVLLALAVSPASADQIYASVPDGMITSSDGGRTWHSESPGSGRGGRALVADPKDRLVAYTASYQTGAIHKTADGGKTWIFVESVGMPVRGGVVELAIDRRETRKVYAWTSTVSRRSVDAGESWASLEDWLLPNWKAGSSLAIDSEGVVYTMGMSGIVRLKAPRGP